MSYNQVTLATLRTRMSERWGSSPFWSNDDADQALNEAIRVWNLYTGQWKTSISKTTEAGRVWYYTGESIFYPLRMLLGSTPLAPTNLFDLDYVMTGWEGHTTASGGTIPTTVKMWAPSGLDMFALWPADAVGGQTLTIWAIQDAPVLVNATDYINIGKEEEQAIVGHALHTSSFKEGGPRFEATAKFYQEFMQAAMGKNLRLKESTFFRRHMGLDLDRGKRPIMDPEQEAAMSKSGSKK